jgi:hypothetical protein
MKPNKKTPPKEINPTDQETGRGCNVATCSSSRTISEDGLRSHHWNHLRAAEEMARAHVDQSNCINVLLEFYPKMSERAEPLSLILREIFQRHTVTQNCLRTIAAVAVDSDIRQLANDGINYETNGKHVHPLPAAAEDSNI